jgi:hypothetical protein
LELEIISLNSLVEEKFFLGQYIHLQGEGIYMYLSIRFLLNYDMLFGKGKVETLLNGN